MKDIFPKGERTRLFWEKRRTEYWPGFPNIHGPSGERLEPGTLLERRERRSRWLEEGRELVRGRARDWCARNPEKVREAGRRYTAKRRASDELGS